MFSTNTVQTSRKKEGVNINSSWGFFFFFKIFTSRPLNWSVFSHTNCCLCAIKECYKCCLFSFWVHKNWFTISWKVYFKVAARRKLHAFISPTINNCEPCTWNMPLKLRGMQFIFMFDFSTQPHLAIQTLMTSDWAAIFTSVGWQTVLIVCVYTIETFPSWMRSLGLVCDKGIDSKRCSIASLCHRHVVEWRRRERLNAPLQSQVRSPTGSVYIFKCYHSKFF